SDLGHAEPFEHYLMVGWREGRNPCALLATRYYWSQLGNIEPKPEPITHYRTEGGAKGIKPHPLFDGDWFASAYPDERSLTPLERYYEAGWEPSVAPSPVFDTARYIRHRTDLAPRRPTPLEDYILHGSKIGITPNALFSSSFYKQENPDVVAADHEPYQHYCEYGW